MEPEYPFLESDDEFEGVGAHRDNPRYDLDAHLAELAEQEAADGAD